MVYHCHPYKEDEIKEENNTNSNENTSVGEVKNKFAGAAVV